MSGQSTLGVVIRRRRLELGWTQEELAERISSDEEYVRQSEISRIESGKTALPRRERLERLANALDLPLGELLARSGWASADEYFGRQLHAHDAHLPSRPTVEPDDPRMPVSETVVDVRPRRLNDREERTHPIGAFRQALQVMRAESERLSRNRQQTTDIKRRFERQYALDADDTRPEH